MKLSQWARKNGLSYQTAWNLYKADKLPVKAIRLDTGTILVDDNNINDKRDKKIVIYSRVSNRERKESLETQVERCKQYCIAKGYAINAIYKEIASGMNDSRVQLLKMLDSKPDIIVVENKDRLTRFGFNYIKLLLEQRDAFIDVVNVDEDDETDLMKDLVSIITSFCCRLYGLRRGHNKAAKLKSELEKEENL